MFEIERSDNPGNTWNKQTRLEMGSQRMIWLASYPRSGNTFYRICYELMYQVRTFAPYTTNEGCKFPYEVDGDEPCVLVKTHNLEPVNTWPAVVIVRDGRAAVASWAHFSLARMKQKTSYRDRLRDVIQDKDGWAAFHHHWLNRPNTNVIRFEQLIKDPAPTIQASADYASLGMSPKTANLPEFQDLNKQDPDFFRGGDWRNDFDSELYDLFWENHGDVMTQLGYEYEPLYS